MHLFSQAELNQFKIIIAAGMQEYLTHETIKKLKLFVMNGGYLIIAGHEFGLRFIRYSDAKDAFKFYFSPFFDPLLKTNPDRLAVASAYLTNYLDFFGFSFQRGIGFTFQEKSFDLEITKKDHHYFNGVDLSSGHPLGRVNSWSPGALIEKVEGEYCLKSKSIPCDQVTIFGFARTKWSENKNVCCDVQLKESKALWGNDSKIIPNSDEFAYAPLMEVQQGKGKILVIPYQILWSPTAGNDRIFVDNLFQSILHK